MVFRSMTRGHTALSRRCALGQSGRVAQPKIDAGRRVEDMFTGAAIALLLFSGSSDPVLVAGAAGVLMVLGLVFVARDRRMATLTALAAALAAAAIVAIRVFLR